MILSEVEDISVSRLESYLDELGDWFINKLFQIIIMLIFLFIAFKIAKLILKIIKKAFDKSRLEDSVSGFLLSLIKILMYVVIIIMAAAMVGLPSWVPQA